MDESGRVPGPLAVLAGVVRAAAQPMLLVWGAERAGLGNDAFAALGIEPGAIPGGEAAARLEGVVPGMVLDCTPVRGEDGALLGTLCVARPRDGESVLGAMLAAVLDALPVGVVIADAHGRILRDNAANRELWGVSPLAVSWEQYGEWVGHWPETGARIAAHEWAMARALLKGEVVRAELVENQRFDTGERRLYLNNAAPVRDASGAIVAGVAVGVDVTERLAMERALRETEERYRLAARAANNAIRDWDLGTDHVLWNEAVRTLFGYAAEEAEPSGAWWKAAIHPEDRGRVVAGIQAVIDGAADTWSDEYRFRRADGGYAHVLDRGTVIRDGRGRAMRMVGAMLDLSERMAVEAALRTRLDAIPQMVWSTRPDGYHDLYNARWYEFTGVPDGSTDGEEWNGMFHPDDREPARARWRHSLETGEPYEIEYRLRHRSGAYRWVLGRALPIRDEAGAIVRWMGTCTDIDALKRTEDELRRTSALLRLIGDSTPDMIYAKDRESRTLYANAAIQRLLGRPVEEVVGRSDLEWAADRREAEAIIANDRRVMETGETIDVDESFTGPDGETRYFRSVKSPLRDAEGNIIGLVGVTSDMTERRRAEERERLLAREVDHRAKNMLAVVQSLVHLTRADSVAALKESVAGRIQALARAHNLLAAARWEGVDVGKLAREELAPFAGRNAARVAVEGPLVRLRPEAAQALALVLHELATNAAKYGALSAGEGRLELGWAVRAREADNDLLELTWRESGGPPVTTPTHMGFGSTLIRSGIQHQLNGTVVKEWRPEGLVCTLRFPVERAVGSGAGAGRPAETAKEAKGAKGAKEAKAADGRRVLVVEDEALVAMQIAEILREAGCTVLGPAASIAEAADHLHGTSVQAALLDVNLAGGRSFPIADILAAKRVPFAFCTGYAGAADLPERFAAVPIVAKPFSTHDIVGVLRRLGG